MPGTTDLTTVRRRTWPRPLVLLACLTIIGGATAACGDDDSGGSSEGSTTTGSEASSGTTPVSLEGEVNDHGTETAEGTAPSLSIEADDYFFGPTFVQAAAGATITIEIANEGDATHTFTIDDLNIDETIDAGSSVEVEVTAPDSGSLNFYCRFHRARGMQGAVFVG